MQIDGASSEGNSGKSFKFKFPSSSRNCIGLSTSRNVSSLQPYLSRDSVEDFDKCCHDDV